MALESVDFKATALHFLPPGHVNTWSMQQDRVRHPRGMPGPVAPFEQYRPPHSRSSSRSR